MKTKQCGTCEFWDRDNVESIIDYSIANCLFKIPDLPNSLMRMNKTHMTDSQGQNCPVYKEVKQWKYEIEIEGLPEGWKPVKLKLGTHGNIAQEIHYIESVLVIEKIKSNSIPQK